MDIQFYRGIGAAIFGIIFYYLSVIRGLFVENGDVLFVSGLFALFSLAQGFDFKSAHEKLSQ